MNLTYEISPEIRCMRLLRRLQQRNRFITLDQDLPLTIIQSFIVLEIASGRDTPAELAKLFAVDQSTMSRNLTLLARDGYIKPISSTTDRRKRNIILLKSGKKFILEYDKLSNLQIARYSFLMSKENLDEFTNLFKEFNDAILAPQINGHIGDSAIRIEMRRIVFGLGAFDKSFMGSELSVAEWQLLSELVYQNKALNQSEIAKITGAAQSSLPALVQRLVARGLLKLKPRLGDKRATELFASIKAKKLIQKAEQVFANRIYAGLAALTHNRQEKFLTLFELFIGESVQGELMISEKYFCRQAKEIQPLAELRALLLSGLANQDKLALVPSKMFDPASLIWLIYNQERQIVGGIEIEQKAKQTLILNLLMPEDKNKKELFTNLINVIDLKQPVVCSFGY